MTFKKIICREKKEDLQRCYHYFNYLKIKKIYIENCLTDQHTQKKFGNTYKICQKELGINSTKVIKFHNIKYVNK